MRLQFCLFSFSFVLFFLIHSSDLDGTHASSRKKTVGQKTARLIDSLVGKFTQINRLHIGTLAYLAGTPSVGYHCAHWAVPIKHMLHGAEKAWVYWIKTIPPFFVLPGMYLLYKHQQNHRQNKETLTATVITSVGLLAVGASCHFYILLLPDWYTGSSSDDLDYSTKKRLVYALMVGAAITTATGIWKLIKSFNKPPISSCPQTSCMEKQRKQEQSLLHQ